MAESSLSVGWTELQQEVGYALGHGRTIASFTADQASLVEDIVQSGIRKVYYPPAVIPPSGGSRYSKAPEPIVGHIWSWITPTSSLAVTDGVDDYTLPDDFGRLRGRMHFAANSEKREVSEISVSELLALRAEDTTAGDAQYVAIQPVEGDGSTGHRFTALLYPTPNADLTMYVEYEVLPSALDDTYPYPLGGMSLSELYIESCLSVVESRVTGGDVHTQLFKRLLIDAILRDRQDIDSLVHVYDADSATFGLVDLRRWVGRELGYGTANSVWSTDQLNEIDSFVNAGVRRVYTPPTVGNVVGHEWSWLKDSIELDIIVDDYEYDLPADFGRMRSKFSYEKDKYLAPISIISVVDLLDLRAGGELTQAPQYAAIRFKDSDGTTRQLQEVLFFPTPDDSYTLLGEYDAYTGRLTAAAPVPLGGDRLNELYIESCLAQVERDRAKQEGVHCLEFSRLLLDAITRDRKKGPRNFGNMGHRDSHSINIRRGDTGSSHIVTYNGADTDGL